MSYAILYSRIRRTPVVEPPEVEQPVVEIKKRLSVVRGDIRKQLYPQAFDGPQGEGWCLRVESRPDPDVGK